MLLYNLMNGGQEQIGIVEGFSPRGTWESGRPARCWSFWRHGNKPKNASHLLRSNPCPCIDDTQTNKAADAGLRMTNEVSRPNINCSRPDHQLPACRHCLTRVNREVEHHLFNG